jgi:hypothetical protein
MPPKRNPLNLNALQLKTLTLLQELARLTDYSRPDEVRSMLSSYRTGIERGRTVAGGANPGERPPDAP